MHRRFGSLLALVALATLLLGPLASTTLAADGLTITARALLGGHARIGGWMGIQVDLANDGPAITGELRLVGGSQAQTRFGTAVDLPTQSRKSYLLYVQPPAFGDSLDVALVASGERIVTKTAVSFTIHDPTQLVVGVIAEKPEGIARSLRLLPGQNGQTPAIVTLAARDLPEKVEAWSALDQLIWQDVDASSLSAGQIAALRGWLASGGRLVVVGGTSGSATLTGMPDGILPFRPTTTIDVPAAALSSLLGPPPAKTPDLPAFAATGSSGRILAKSGDWIIGAEASYGAGSVSILGFDPTTQWIAGSAAADALWRRLIPARSSGGPVVVGDDSQLLQALSSLPSLALPPIGGLLVLLVAYILLVGPINYLVLRRLDRREWAWLTMPALILLFAAGAYGFGAALRGGDVIVDEVAIVRAAPGASEGLADVYVGIFSPTRATYQVRIPGSLVSSTISGDSGNFGTSVGGLDVLQGEPAVVRNLAVGFGSLRALRAETTVDVPKLQADLRLAGGLIVGTIRNSSDQTLEKPAIVMSGSVATLPDLAPGATENVSLRLGGPQQPGQALSDKIFGQVFFNGTNNDDMQRLSIRHSVVDQLTFDPSFGMKGQLPADGPVLLAWASRDVLDVSIENQQVRRVGNTLYYVPIPLEIHGQTAFTPDLVRGTVVDVNASQFGRDPFNFNLGGGSVTVAYRPAAFQGSFAASKLILGMGGDGSVQMFPPGGGVVIGKPLQPGASATDQTSPAPAASAEPTVSPVQVPIKPGPDLLNNVPEVDLFDLTSSTWVRLPEFTNGTSVGVKDPARYVDPTSGSVQVRFSNARQDMFSFQFIVQIEGMIQ